MKDRPPSERMWKWRRLHWWISTVAQMMVETLGTQMKSTVGCASHCFHVFTYLQKSSSNIHAACNVQIHQLLACKPFKRGSHCFHLTASTSGPAININIEALPSISILTWGPAINITKEVVNTWILRASCDMYAILTGENKLDRWEVCWKCADFHFLICTRFINIQAVIITFVIWMIRMICQQ